MAEPPETRSRSRAPGTLRACAPAAFAFLAIALPLAFWPGRLGYRHLAAGAAAGLGCAALAALAAPPLRRKRAFLAAAAAGLAAAGAGSAAGLWREARGRAPSLAEAFRLEPGGTVEAFLERLQRRPPKDVASLLKAAPEKRSRRSDLLLEGRLELHEHEPVSVPRDLSWDEDPLNDKTWRWTLHAMPYVEWLTDSFVATRDGRFLERAEDLVLDWIEDNLFCLGSPPSRMSWHDHATALRVRAWLPFWEQWVKSHLFDEPKAELLLRAVAAHGERLASEAFYTRSHNHGIDQDVALIAIATAFPELRKAREWRDLACARLRTQVFETISPAGVHLEHSAGYHFHTLGVLTAACDFMSRHGIAVEGLDLEEVLRKMARVAAYLIQPDGHIVPIGDTTHEPSLDTSDPVLALHAERDPVLRFALTRGREGSPGDGSVVFEREGYAIFRDAWRPEPDFEKGLHVVLTAAANPGLAHKQADDLSFTFFGLGRELIVDPGHYSYDELDPARRYAVSARAHNVVLVDGEGFSGYSARIEAHALQEGHAVVQASHDNYPGLRHRRTLLYVRPATLFVIDEVGPAGAGGGPAAARVFEQLFHLGPGLKPLVGPGRSSVRAASGGPGEPGVELRVVAMVDGKGTAEVVEGQAEPLQGWISRGHRDLRPAPVLKLTARGGRATFATWIEARASGETQPEGGEGPWCRVEEGSILIRWPAGGGTRQAQIRRGGKLEVRL
ncbi:MAG: alginate lyase family protein [Planctomycetes bacterium]|nr:alginate lyase family protein [Planctomycetota bacterium]